MEVSGKQSSANIARTLPICISVSGSGAGSFRLRPDILRSDTVSWIGAEQRVLNLRAEAACRTVRACGSRSAVP